MKQALKHALAPVMILGLSVSWGLARSDPEARILNYIRNHLKAGQPIEIRELWVGNTAPAVLRQTVAKTVAEQREKQ